METAPQGFGWNFWKVIGATFLGFLGIGTVLPGLAPYVKHNLGGSDQMVGFVIGVFYVVALVSRFFSGPFADSRGRKAAFLAGLVSCALAGLVYLIPFGIAAPILGRMLQGFGEACLYTGAAAWVVELGGIRRSAQALGYLSSGIWGGVSAGPAMGHWLGTFERAAMLQVVCAILAIALLLRVKEDYQPGSHHMNRKWVPTRLILPGLTVGFVNVQYPVIAGFLILHLAQHGNSGPAAFSAYALVILFSRFFLGGLPDRLHPAITFYSGLGFMALGLLGLAAGPSPFFAIAAAGILGFGFSFPWASIASKVLRATPERERGSAVSVLSAFYDFFVGVSALAAGAVSDRFGYPSAFVMAAAALGVAAVVGRFVFFGVSDPSSVPVALGADRPQS